MLAWCNQSDGFVGDFKGTAADMAAHEARKRHQGAGTRDMWDAAIELRDQKIKILSDDNHRLDQLNLNLLMESSIEYSRHLEATLAARDAEIKRLHQVVEDKQDIIDKFIVKSNGLSMFVRSDIFGRSNLPRLDEQLWSLYNFQCEIEFPEEEENPNVDPSTI